MSSNTNYERVLTFPLCAGKCGCMVLAEKDRFIVWGCDECIVDKSQHDDKFDGKKALAIAVEFVTKHPEYKWVYSGATYMVVFRKYSMVMTREEAFVVANKHVEQFNTKFGGKGYLAPPNSP